MRTVETLDGLTDLSPDCSGMGAMSFLDKATVVFYKGRKTLGFPALENYIVLLYNSVVFIVT